MAKNRFNPNNVLQVNKLRKMPEKWCLPSRTAIVLLWWQGLVSKG